MHIGILQFELLVHDATSLKDKRRVVKSLKDKLHREHLVSIAEVAALDHHRLAVMGCSLVSNSHAHIDQAFDRIYAKLKSLTDAELGSFQRDILSGSAIESPAAEGSEEERIASIPTPLPGKSRASRRSTEIG